MLLVPRARERYTPADNWYEKNDDKEKMFVKHHSYVRRREERDPSDYGKNVAWLYTVRCSIK